MFEIARHDVLIARYLCYPVTMATTRVFLSTFVVCTSKAAAVVKEDLLGTDEDENAGTRVPSPRSLGAMIYGSLPSPLSMPKSKPSVDYHLKSILCNH